MTVQSPPPLPPPAAPRKGMGPLAWVGIGCGVILVIVVLGVMAFGFFVKRQVDKFENNPTMAAAALVIKMTPGLELVSADEEKNTLTVKNTETGEVITMNAEDVKEGKITFTTKDGTTTFDGSGGENGGSMTVTNDKGETATFVGGGDAPKNLPSWVPTYPGGTTTGSFDATANNERTAAFSVATSDSVDDVIAFYEEQLKGAGLEVQKSTYEANGQKGGSVTGTSSDQKRTVNVLVATGDQGGAQATVTFSDKQ